MEQDRIKAILDYWFADFDEDVVINSESKCVQRWFSKDKKVDAEIKTNFSEDVKKALEGQYDSWAETAEGRLALIILLDQFTRSIYRDSEKAFSGDLKALALAGRSVKDGFDGRVDFVARQFFYMPLMHSENVQAQEMSAKAFGFLVEEAITNEDVNVEYLKYVNDFAKRHQAIILDFGRFPHRNKILDRRSTSDETAFLQTPNSSF